jgi:hypothetical protein
MTEAHRRAVELAQHYFRPIAEQTSKKREGNKKTKDKQMVTQVIKKSTKI